MRTFIKPLAAGAGIAALAAAAPATAQYYGYGHNPYASSQAYSPYGYGPYGYSQPYAAYGMNNSVATQQCTAAVQNRLYSRTSLGSILGSLVGVPTNSGRVLSITQVMPRSNGTLQVRGLASSGRYAYNNYSPYGVGAYGALGYNYASQADLSFKCDVDYRGYVRDVDINRRY